MREDVRVKEEWLNPDGRQLRGGCEVVGLGEEVAAVWEKTMLCVANKAMNVIKFFLVKFNCR